MIRKMIFDMVIIVILIILLYAYRDKSKMKVERFSYGNSRFCYNGKDLVYSIKKQDLDGLYKILNRKVLFYEGLSCGFSNDIAICIDGKYTFCFAQDGDPYVYLKEENKYIKLSNKEYGEMVTILKKYGFIFPCI